MDNSYEEQTEFIEKIIIQIRKEIALPSFALKTLRTFLNYTYSIAYYKGYRLDNNKAKNIAIFNNKGEVLDVCKTVAEAAKYTGLSIYTINSNIYGRKLSGKYEFRYTKREPTIF